VRSIALVVLLAACGSKPDQAASGSAEPRPTVKDPIGFCARARLVLSGRRKCFPEDTSIKMAIEEIAGIEAAAPTEPVARRKQAGKCARMLDGMARAEQPANCPLDATDEELAELAAFLAAK
jgi:hypothetical protein